jgi:hypothetical protein
MATDLRVLSLVGDESQPIRLVDVSARVFADPPHLPPDATDEAKAAHAQQCREMAEARADAVDVYGAIAVRVRVVDELAVSAMDELQRLSAISGLEASKAAAAAEGDPDKLRAAAKLRRKADDDKAEADRYAIKVALAGVEGFRGVAELTPQVVDALCRSQFRWLIAHTCRNYQRVDEESRAGFFTPAPGS